MKKLIFLIVCISILSASLASCRQATEPQSDQTKSTSIEDKSIASYFPVKENTLYVYEGDWHELASHEIYNTYLTDNIIQRRLKTSQSEGIEILSFEKDEIKVIFADAGVYYYENLTNVVPSLDFVVLREPLELGNSWSMDETKTREITNVSVEVETPMGTFDALEVTIRHIDGAEDKEYYVKDLGLVKYVFKRANGVQNETVLTEVVEDTGFQRSFLYYSPDNEENSIISEERNLIIHTNTDLKNQFEAEMKTDTRNTMALFTENTKINLLEVDRTKSLVHLDLSEDFITERSIGGGIEALILQSITNTLCHFYQVYNMQITIDGGVYESSHFTIEMGEFLEIDIHGGDSQ